MASIFSRIIAGELPGRFVWQDSACVAFLTIAPLSQGHTLVVPRGEVDRWTEIPTELLNHLTDVAQKIGHAQRIAFAADRAGLIIAGFEVEHLHLHVWPANSLSEFDFSTVDQNPDPAVMDQSAEKLRAQLLADGWAEFVPQS